MQIISIKIISAECKKCKKLESIIRLIVEKEKILTVIEKITDIHEMTKYGFITLPALIINEKIKSHGYLPKEEQITKWLKEN